MFKDVADADNANKAIAFLHGQVTNAPLRM
jgi:hypothetical protein